MLEISSCVHIQKVILFNLGELWQNIHLDFKE